MERQRVLFICTHNSARSQMAEGFLRHWAGDTFDVYSAGTEVTEVRPEAIKVMAEIGIDISQQQSKHYRQFFDQEWDWLITVCDQAKESCPVFPGAERTSHWGFEDPSQTQGTEDERLKVFRRVRDDIGQRLRTFILAAGRAEPEQRMGVRLEREPRSAQGSGVTATGSAASSVSSVDAGSNPSG
ncbi:MAG: arsenate reductase ArsC [Chloroflexi bacterium]|nr:arsenate reductase ArsC [Chloroflexota bacterium]